MNCLKYLNHTSPLASRIMRTVFGIYLLIAITLTLIQMLMQYKNEEKRLYNQMDDLSANFAPVLAQAMWDINDKQLQVTMSGLITTPEIVGISIFKENGQPISLGTTNSKQNAPTQKNNSSPAKNNGLITYDFNIEYKHSESNLYKLGVATFYSSPEVIADRVWDTLLITFILACFKTFCLWLIIAITLKTLVAKPLEKLGQIMHGFDPNEATPENPKNAQNTTLNHLSIKQTKNNLSASDELDTVEKNFVRMIEKITDQKQKLLTHHNNLNSIFNALPDLYFKLNNNGVILDYKAQDTNEFYVNPDLFLGKKMIDVLPANVTKVFSEHFHRYFANNEQNTWEYNLKVNGKDNTYEARLRSIKDRDEFILLIRNITEEKKTTELIWHQANMDDLTGLPNRNMLNHSLQMAVEKSKRTRLPLALLFLDLDQFKEINDTLGHDAGDALLKEAAHRIKDCIREIDFIGRQGGDEFTIILNDIEDINIVETISNRILSALTKPFLLDSNNAYISASIGITFYPENAKSVADLLITADQAMYAAKARGRNCFNYYTPCMQEAAIAKMRLTNDLRKAVSEGQFKLYFQPIVSLHTGRVCKAEALLRWQHPIQGLILPAEFISLAEETQMIVDIGDWVLEEASRNLVELKALYGDDFQLSINISPVQFASEKSSADQWLNSLKAQGLAGNSIIGEITESLMMEANEETMKKLIIFGEKNIQIALDDFGTGYSSLSYLKKYNIDYLKIDQSFLTNLTAGSDDYALCEAIIVMAHKLGIKVVAEGIETQEQYNLLMLANCDFGQGYFICPPAELESLLKKSSKITPT
jgi:diguanylate cyclase (GGDEF)-like protein